MYWWRVRGRVGATEGARTSHVWEFVVGARDRATDTQWGTLTDVNGDGFGDVVVGGSSMPRAHRFDQIMVSYGASGGLPMMPSWTSTPSTSTDGFGSSVASAGDINGDGFGDVVVGAPSATNAAMVSTGAVSIFFGSATGLSLTAQRVSVGAAGDQFGYAVSAAGDVNGDGFGDLVVGAISASPGGRTSAGTVYVFHGGASGVAATPAAEIAGTVPRGALGAVVTGAHDLNADRFADIVVAAPLADDPAEGESEVGVVRCFHGGASGVGSTPTREWTRVEGPAGLASGYRVGRSLSRPGDINGDGFGDVVFGSGDNNAKRDALWSAGSMQGASANLTRISTASSADREVGAQVDLGDANGDGFDDLLLQFRVDGMRRTEVRAGGAVGVAASGALVVAGHYDAGFVGDINGDGRAETIVAVNTIPIFVWPTAAQLYRGNPGLSWVMPDWFVSGPSFR